MCAAGLACVVVVLFPGAFTGTAPHFARICVSCISRDAIDQNVRILSDLGDYMTMFDMSFLYVASSVPNAANFGGT